MGPGGLFLALPGERADGHDFAAQAVTRGATAVLAGREVDGPGDRRAAGRGARQ
ncbi:Mur ligase domain-containing protein, partial [Pseudonocardia sp. ICBG601]|uniref:Mur ligase domain-containing protein n=1 Tax=Pseudonocardia sp. ICBG601 TaxID=2846759 RepID=UPI0035AC278B